MTSFQVPLFGKKYLVRNQDILKEKGERNMKMTRNQNNEYNLHQLRYFERKRRNQNNEYDLHQAG